MSSSVERPTRGHRVVVEAELLKTTEGGLKWPVEEGSRSIAFMFPMSGNPHESTGLGAVVERLLDGGAPGGQLRAIVAFWSDLAAIYATCGANFDLWLGRTVGHGTIRDVFTGS